MDEPQGCYQQTNMAGQSAKSRKKKKEERHNRDKTSICNAPCESPSASEHSSGEGIICKWCLGGVQVSQGCSSLNKENEVSASQRIYSVSSSMSSKHKVLSETGWRLNQHSLGPGNWTLNPGGNSLKYAAQCLQCAADQKCHPALSSCQKEPVRVLGAPTNYCCLCWMGDMEGPRMLMCGCVMPPECSDWKWVCV